MNVSIRLQKQLQRIKSRFFLKMQWNLPSFYFIRKLEINYACKTIQIAVIVCPLILIVKRFSRNNKKAKLNVNTVYYFIMKQININYFLGYWQ